MPNMRGLCSFVSDDNAPPCCLRFCKDGTTRPTQEDGPGVGARSRFAGAPVFPVTTWVGIMRLLVVAEDFPALSETFVINQIIGLRRLGFDVAVMADRRRVEAVMHESVHSNGLLEAVRYARAPAGRFRTVGSLLRLAGRSAIRFDPLALQEIALLLGDRISVPGMHCAPGRVLGFLDPLAERLASFDAVLCHFGPNGDMMTRVARLTGARVPIVTIFHGYDASSYIRSGGDGVYRRLFERGALFLAVSHAIRERLLALGCPPDRLHLQRTGVDSGQLAYGYTGGGDAGPFTFLTVGRLVEKKGIEVAIRALALCRGRLPGRAPCLDIIGDGALLDHLQAVAESLGVAHAVRFQGALPHERVLAAMRGAGALVQPSITGSNGDQEGTPVVLQEGMALGLPVLATRHGGIVELVEDGVDGLLVPERDPDALAAAMSRVVEDRELRLRVSHAGRRKVVREFDLSHWNDALAGRLRSVTEPTAERAA